MNSEEWREYNKDKQKEYRTKKRGRPPRQWMSMSRIEEILKSAGHCPYCSMLLESEYHKKHPLIGCMKWM